MKLIETFMYQDEWNNGQEYIACKLSVSGENWILENQDQLEFKFDKSLIQSEPDDDDLPF